jgi:glucokinase
MANSNMSTSSPHSSPQFPWLVADIGGSNARFGWISSPDSGINHIQTLPVSEFATPILASQQYLSHLAALLKDDYQAPHCAAFAVATVASSDEIQFTNSHWNFSKTQVKAALGLERFIVLNDFEALALSLPRLRPDQLIAHGALPQPTGTLAVIGPGTGLGVGTVIKTKHEWVAVPGEGGHSTLAATDAFEAAVLNEVRNEYAHISAERLLSGIGIPVLYRGVAKVMQHADDKLTTEQIVERALQKQDAVCEKTLDLFCALLGSFCGNVALIVGAHSGVYIGGGIVPRLGDYFFQSRFREKFEAKGRLSPYLNNIPTALISDTLAALSGASLAIEQS